MSEATERKPAKAKKKPAVSGIIKTMLDEEGNRIIATDKGNILIIDLKLKKERKRRRIGQVTKSTRTIHLTRKRGLHLHLLSNSYGFNYKIMEAAKSFDIVSLTDEHKRWKFLRQDILDCQNFLFFKQQGFELQTFISLEELDRLTLNYANNNNASEPKFIL